MVGSSDLAPASILQGWRRKKAYCRAIGVKGKSGPVLMNRFHERIESAGEMGLARPTLHRVVLCGAHGTSTFNSPVLMNENLGFYAFNFNFIILVNLFDRSREDSKDEHIMHLSDAVLESVMVFRLGAEYI